MSHPPRILVVEDGPDNQVILTALLERNGAEVVVVENGARGVCEALRACENGEPYDLVFMDRDMPVQDGLSATRELRRQGYALPIVALTARCTEEDLEESFAAGANEHMTKPASCADLGAALERFVRRPPKRSGTMPRVLVSDYAADDEMREILHRFVRALPERAAQLMGALDGGDLTTLRRLAHQLKGSAGGYGFPAISRAASALNEGILAGEKPDRVKARVDELTQLLFLARASVPPPGMPSEGLSSVASSDSLGDR